MELIPSFAVDHTLIIPGIFVSRQDAVGDEVVTTYDIRVTRPNVEPAMDPSGIHTLEHLIATFLRNNEEWKDKIIYWGPMGCLTGFYLILKGNYKPQEIFPLIVEAFSSVEKAQEVPGATKTNCGNACLHNLMMAKYYAKRFVEYLTDADDHCDTDIFEYPKTDRLTTEEGQQFFDS